MPQTMAGLVNGKRGETVSATRHSSTILHLEDTQVLTRLCCMQDLHLTCRYRGLNEFTLRFASSTIPSCYLPWRRCGALTGTMLFHNSQLSCRPSLLPLQVVAATHAMYAIPSNSTSRGRRLAAAYSFGSAVRPASSGILQSVPGPGTYNIFSAIGKTQPSSQMRSQPTTSFGEPPLRGTSRGLPTHSESPGPVYSMKNAVACGQQHLSPSRSLPNYAFSKSKRFCDPSTSAVRDGPGPGEYCV